MKKVLPCMKRYLHVLRIKKSYVGVVPIFSGSVTLKLFGMFTGCIHPGVYTTLSWKGVTILDR